MPHAESGQRQHDDARSHGADYTSVEMLSWYPRKSSEDGSAVAEWHLSNAALKGDTMRPYTRFLMASFVLLVTLPAARPASAQGFGIHGGFAYDTATGDGLLDDIQGRSGWLAGINFGGGGVVGFMGEISYVVRET